MRHEEGYFWGVRGTRIYRQDWLPEDEVEAAVLIVHGLGEHSGRYANVVNHLVPLGYAVYGFDLIGHGKSDGEREFVERFDDFTLTLKTYFDLVHEAQPDKPVVLYGHSLGALIGPYYLLDRQDELAGAILSGALVKVPPNVSTLTVSLGKVLSRTVPHLRLVPLDPTGVSRDPAVVQAYVSDPLVFHGKTTARLGAELLAAMQHVMAGAASIRLPLLLLQGSADRLVDPEGASMLYNAVGSTDKTLKVYNGLGHEVHNEPERATVLADVQTWLGARL